MYLFIYWSIDQWLGW